MVRGKEVVGYDAEVRLGDATEVKLALCQLEVLGPPITPHNHVLDVPVLWQPPELLPCSLHKRHIILGLFLSDKVVVGAQKCWMSGIVVCC